MSGPRFSCSRDGGISRWGNGETGNVLGEEEEDEAHAVDDDAEVLEEGGDGARPEIAHLELEGIFDEAEAERGEEGRNEVHDHGEEAGGDGVEAERGDGDEHSAM